MTPSRIVAADLIKRIQLFFYQEAHMLVTLTPDFVSTQLVCPAHLRRVELVDQGGLGLYIEVRASSPGVGTYYLRYKDANGKTCHQKIGSTAVISIAEARKEAKRLKAEWS
jgi:Arm DNA-binding domain